MLSHLAKSLKGENFRVFIYVLINSHEGIFKNFDMLRNDIEIKDDEMWIILERLEKKGFLQIIDESVMLRDEFKEFAKFIRSYSSQLLFKIDEPEEKENKNPSSQDIRKLVEFYAKAKGIPDSDITEWNRQNFGRLIKPASKLLSYTKDLQKAQDIVMKAKSYYEGSSLKWSLDGAILRNIELFLAVIKKDERKWTW